MIGTGKYNFLGMRKAGAFAIKMALAMTTWGAYLVTGPFKGVVDALLEFFSEWLANKGLLIIDLGAIYGTGEFDQARFDKAVDEGLEKIKVSGLTEKQKKAIDDQVIQAFRNFGRVTRFD